MGCDKCPKGEYMVTDCSTLKNSTNCARCPKNHYTEGDNNLLKCIVCKDCSSAEHLREKTSCLPDRDVQCECEEGFYCTDPKAVSCTHCEVRTKCRPGQGAVKFGASEDTSCEPCPQGTFSNVTGYSPCRPHTNCEGQEVKQKGTDITDAVCDKPLCSTPHGYWLLPAGLWVGLIVSALIIAAYFYWKAKRRSRHTGVYDYSVVWDSFRQREQIQ
ncbi:tumor necrosis factor receptor superfamily member 3 isoform X2 [Clupea harengus]|uniref:Tumor necrosis factor receptor superfamily member 3 isoform X2 n=1 Tax=Clupea harengus TaxID=7950 RepID=A0A6P8FU10_CLUHA|nr:tumor necrosis factor receptor superfamily member 3 isoform X2 [Clupea harengus]